MQRRTLLKLGAGAAFGATIGTGSSTAVACTRVLWNNNKLAVLVGRTMDWPESTQPVLTVLPRGMQRDGGRIGPATAVAENPLRWTSKHGSLVTTTYGIGSADGINEQGLGAHLLYLNATDFGVRNSSMPGLHAGLWAQFVLDNAATVHEALALLRPVQLVMVEAQGRKATVHLAMEDATGDSAIVEHIDGKPVIHHGRQYRIMTNDPSYSQQLALLKKYDLSKPSREMPLPGNVAPTDRFVRATYYEGLLPQPKSEREAVAGMFSVMASVSVPFGAPYGEFGIYNTEYRTVGDLTNRIYFFQLTTVPSVIWAHLPKFDLAPGSPVMVLNPDNIELCGDETDAFQKAVSSPF